MEWPPTLVTGPGSWNPLLWLCAFLMALAMAILIRSRGRSDYRAGPQSQPFLSGNEVPEDGRAHIPASNLYWGFLESLLNYYQRLVPLHTGILTDYLAWFLGVLALMLIVGLVL